MSDGLNVTVMSWPPEQSGLVGSTAWMTLVYGTPVFSSGFVYSRYRPSKARLPLWLPASPPYSGSTHDATCGAVVTGVWLGTPAPDPPAPEEDEEEEEPDDPVEDA